MVDEAQLGDAGSSVRDFLSPISAVRILISVHVFLLTRSVVDEGNEEGGGVTLYWPVNRSARVCRAAEL